MGDISGEAAMGAMSGFWKTARASWNGLSNPTVMTRKGSASDMQTGSMGTLRRYAARRATRKPKMEETRVAKAERQ
jgi:hypothetical protein